MLAQTLRPSLASLVPLLLFNLASHLTDSIHAVIPYIPAGAVRYTVLVPRKHKRPSAIWRIPNAGGDLARPGFRNCQDRECGLMLLSSLIN